ncbi:tRNA uridine-5-carboxymethylaminomethyl(34) synthesis GTPase MnmE [Halonatronum saccharophilum]|uniref:tRNA uridine-5-carboxymethylaminomethyl(34) synthesis GTPase MnmE n=1 Tax=Halonatronum saccharophilum TaxID=150060 RepID=UPI00048A28F1|nr:tRNA uridine-5-carboxymethylaminomethyl(34) synthesis GTPase MnmE [Halonatronum saccharophilum]
MYKRDTIAAISTAVGDGGIGIIRVSGSEAIEIVDLLFKGKEENKLINSTSYKAHYGHIVERESGKIIDEVITLVMKAPKTYTTEDVVEINCHGGIVVLQKILNLVLKAGVRLAEPGEFTKRAFLNGRIDLAQAEAITDLIRSKTEAGLEVALKQLEGSLSNKINDIRQDIVSLLAHLEATIDFPDDEVEEFDPNQLDTRIGGIINKVEDLIKTSNRGKILKEGIKAAIIGKPNVGKSSLLNALLREKRAIVTDIPGTTRDIIEEVINIDGIPVKIIDTAGIRETEDVVEKVGVEKSEDLLKEADLILLVLDASQAISEEELDIVKKANDKDIILVINKVDLKEEIELGDIELILDSKDIVKTAAIDNEGIDKLEDTISSLIFRGDISSNSDTLISNIRHKNALDRAYGRLLDVQKTFQMGLPNDFITIDLRAALESIGEITGDTIGEDIIDQIFADFCLGK